MRRATDAVDALKRAKPANAAEARKRASELVRQQHELLDAAHRITEGAAAKRIAGTNGHAKGKQADVFTDEVLQALARGLVPFWTSGSTRARREKAGADRWRHLEFGESVPPARW